MRYERTQNAFQKSPNRIAKGLLSPSDLDSFALRFGTYWKMVAFQPLFDVMKIEIQKHGNYNFLYIKMKNEHDENVF